MDGLGGRIRAARDKSGRTRNEVANELGVDPTTIFRWEKGNSVPAHHLARLATLFGVTTDSLLYGDDAPSSKAS